MQFMWLIVMILFILNELFTIVLNINVITVVGNILQEKDRSVG